MLRGAGAMRFEATSIEGAWLVHLERQTDSRGSFGRLFCAETFAAHGLAGGFVQESLSVTRQAGSLRGMHYQRAPHAEVKYLRCLRGAIHDVVADLRPDSPSRGRWQAFQLAAGDDTALYIPAGCAHGFQTLTDDVELLYHMSVAYQPGFADGFRFDDPAFAIAWPREVTVISERDLTWPPLAGRATAGDATAAADTHGPRHSFGA
ncbi:MAG TPA: dTDP-4-dehydrorhamnose 3,5-epimerase family protein [Acetobacteraceae bacterium]|nr:dTDP-4-dehydrorhamnose 3,5-epimerase family protein [Acetobacteraceae bacterium]